MQTCKFLKPKLSSKIYTRDFIGANDKTQFLWMVWDKSLPEAGPQKSVHMPEKSVLSLIIYPGVKQSSVASTLQVALPSQYVNVKKSH